MKIFLNMFPFNHFQFGTNRGLICANMTNEAYILNEQKMSSDFRDDVILLI